jgi:hypothetical protein
MGFTVAHSSGLTTSSEYLAYTRLLRKKGVDLGQTPRVQDQSGNRWLYVWDRMQEAVQFANELNRDAGAEEWVVREVNAPASRGPLGPLVIQLARRVDGFSFSIHPLSKAVIKSAFPDAQPGVTRIFVDVEKWMDWKSTQGGIDDLTRELALPLTGLDRDQLDGVGFVLVDDETGKTLIDAKPVSLLT